MADGGKTSRVSIKTIAQELGVSICTVNKALTNKPKISAATREKVIATAARLGYSPNQLARTLVRGELNIALIYPAAWPSYMEGLVQGALEKLNSLRDYRINGIQIKVDDFYDGDACVNVLKQATGKFDGIVFILGIYPQIKRIQIWRQLESMNLPYVLLGVDVEEPHPALARVNQNSRLCGQLAADLLSLMLRPLDKAAILIGRMDVLDHKLKVAGFEEKICLSGLNFAGFHEAHDRQMDAYGATAALLQKHPDVAGIYIATENSGGVMEFLHEHQLTSRIKVVATGHADSVLEHLRESRIQASINENLRTQGNLAMETLFRYLTLKVRPSEKIFVDPGIILKSNADRIIYGMGQ